MKLSLVVQSPSKWAGKVIPITVPEFVIGRDPSCHLRPAHVLISKRHCALVVRGEQVFVKDFNSTNGTLINERPVQGEAELQDQDRLHVGPAVFRVVMEALDQQTVPVVAKRSSGTTDEEAAALLLSLQDDEIPRAAANPVDADGVPSGSTVLDTLSSSSPQEEQKPENENGDKAKSKAAKTNSGDTSTAAKAILEKYIRRPRS